MCFFLDLFLRNKEGFQPSKRKVDFVTVGVLELFLFLLLYTSWVKMNSFLQWLIELFLIFYVEGGIKLINNKSKPSRWNTQEYNDFL